MDVVITKLIQRVLLDNQTRIMKVFGKAAGAVRDSMSFSCANYIQDQFERCSHVKTLLDRDDATLISDIYVGTRLTCNNKIFSDEKFLMQMKPGDASVIIGGGGTGKSMFMKNLFLTLLSNLPTSIPVFVDLRSLNFKDIPNILVHVYESMTGSSDVRMTLHQFEKAIAGGVLLLAS